MNQGQPAPYASFTNRRCAFVLLAVVGPLAAGRLIITIEPSTTNSAACLIVIPSGHLALSLPVRDSSFALRHFPDGIHIASSVSGLNCASARLMERHR